jgi:hypothetical protein
MRLRSLVLVPVVSLAVLAGCTGPHGRMAGMGPGPGMMGSPGMAGQTMPMGGGNPAQMCEMYRQMMAGKTPTEQQAAMESMMRSMHGGNVTPEQMRMQREMMERNCPNVAR